MAWNKDLPDDSGIIREAPGQIRNNNEAIQQADISLQQWAINLIDRTDPTVTGPNDPVREDNVMFLYAKNDGTETELYLENDNNPADAIQMSRSSEVDISANGSTFLPGGLLLQWGKTANVGTSTTLNVTFPTPFRSNVYNIQLTRTRASASINANSLEVLGTPALTDFDIRNTSTSTIGEVFWMAIGV